MKVEVQKQLNNAHAHADAGVMVVNEKVHMHKLHMQTTE